MFFLSCMWFQLQRRARCMYVWHELGTRNVPRLKCRFFNKLLLIDRFNVHDVSKCQLICIDKQLLIKL